jgi:hypothetical protein
MVHDAIIAWIGDDDNNYYSWTIIIYRTGKVPYADRHGRKSYQAQTIAKRTQSFGDEGGGNHPFRSGTGH